MGRSLRLGRDTGRGWGTEPRPRRDRVGSTDGGQGHSPDRGKDTVALSWRKQQVWWK